MTRLKRVLMQSVVGGIFLAGGAGVAFAEERPICPICSKANNESATYGEKAGNTLARGALNVGLGWTEMIRQPGKSAREGKNVFHGIANGVAFSARRTMRGLGEVFTFWVPKVQDRYIHFSKDCPLDTIQ